MYNCLLPILFVLVNRPYNSQVSADPASVTAQRLLRAQIVTESDYDPIVRPASIHSGGLTTIDMDFSLGQLVELDEGRQVMTSKVWINMRWRDERLEWDVDKWNITSLRFTADEIWVPDIVIANNIMDQAIDTSGFLLRVSPNGTVTFPSTHTLETQCELNVELFPYDTQWCPVEFSSWSYLKEEMDFRNGSEYGNSKNYVDNGVWSLLSINVRRQVANVTSLTNGVGDLVYWVKLTYYVHISRSVGYYNLNVITPALIIIFVSFGTFLLPVESGEKVSLVVTVLLATTVYLLVIADNLPAQSKNIPAIALYLAMVTGLMGLATVMTVVIISIHYMGTGSKRAKPLTRKILLRWLPKYILINSWVRYNLEEIKDLPQDDEEDRSDVAAPVNKTFSDEAVEKQTTHRTSENEKEYREKITNIIRKKRNRVIAKVQLIKISKTSEKTNDEWEVVEPQGHRHEVKVKAGKRQADNLAGSGIEHVLQGIHRVIRRQERRILEEANQKALTREWEVIAVVANRACMMLYSCVTAGCTLWFLIKLHSGSLNDYEIQVGFLPLHDNS